MTNAVSARVKFYALQVLQGKMSLSQVPEKYREAVREYLEQHSL